MDFSDNKRSNNLLNRVNHLDNNLLIKEEYLGSKLINNLKICLVICRDQVLEPLAIQCNNNNRLVEINQSQAFQVSLNPNQILQASSGKINNLSNPLVILVPNLNKWLLKLRQRPLVASFNKTLSAPNSNLVSLEEAKRLRLASRLHLNNS